MMTRAASVEERFWNRVPVHEDGECWEWTGWLTRNGYGYMSINSRKVGVHRLAYELFVGPIPEGLAIDHLCRNRRCVNPSHLEPVTQKENVLRGRGLTAENARKTHCPQGHPYDEENTTLVHGGKWRECRQCRRLGQLVQFEKRRAAKATGSLLSSAQGSALLWVLTGGRLGPRPHWNSLNYLKRVGLIVDAPTLTPPFAPAIEGWT